MSQDTLNLFFGVAAIAAVVGLIIAMFLMHRQLSAVTDVLAAANNNPALLNAIRGAEAGVPQDVFVKFLSVLTTLNTLAPGADQKALIDQLTKFLENVDHDPTNDPTASTLHTVKGVPVTPIPPATFQQPARGEDRELAQQ